MSRVRLALVVGLVAALAAVVATIGTSNKGIIATALLVFLLGSGILGWPHGSKPTEWDRLEPIAATPGEGDWSVRLDAYQAAAVVTVLSRSLDITKVAAFLLLKDLPREVLTHATDEHARELVLRLEKVGATATAIQTA